MPHYAKRLGSDVCATFGLSITPPHPLFVAEITGIDLTVPVARDDFRVIWDAFNEYQILVFRDQPFTDETQIAFSRNSSTAMRGGNTTW